MKYLGTAMRICVETVDKKGRKKTKIESYDCDLEANSKIALYSLLGIKAYPYFRQLKKPKKMKMPKIIEKGPEDDIIINSKEDSYELSTEAV